MSDFVDGFVRGCKERGLNDTQIKTAAAAAVKQHPELREEFGKAAWLPLALGAVAGAALPWVLDKVTGSGKPSDPAAAKKAPEPWDPTPSKPEVTSGAPPSNMYSAPGQGGAGPRFWPSMAMPPGGFPGYGPTGHPGSPYGTTSPFNHTVLPPFMPKMGAADEMDKEAWLPLVAGAARVLPRLANSGVGRLASKGLSGLGSLFNKGLPAGVSGPAAPNLLQRAGQSVAETGAARAKALADAHPYGNLAAMAQSGAKPGFLSTHGMTLGMTGAMMAPMFMGGGGGEMPRPQPDERQASWLPPTIGGEKRADTAKPAELFPGELDGLFDEKPAEIKPTKPGGPVKPKSPAPTKKPAAAAPVPEALPPVQTPSMPNRLVGGLTRTGLGLAGGAALGLGAHQLIKHLVAPYQSSPSPAALPQLSNPFAKASAMLPGGKEDLRDLPAEAPKSYVPPKESWKPRAARIAGAGLALGAGAATAYGIHKLTEKKSANPFG